jgi:hypothetical protein
VANPCNWEAIDRFNSLAHYEEFLRWITGQIAEGRAQAVPMDPAKAWGTAWDEHWYECLASNDVWRLVGPDPPFRGIFKKVEAS